VRTPLATFMIGVLVVIGPLVAAISAADRPWQTGKWTESSTTRQLLDFGPGSSPFGGPGGPGGPGVPTMRAMADVRVYVIETDALRLELKDVVPVGRRSIEVTIGTPVTFAIDKNSLYVKDADGTEHKLRITKKIAKPHP
jgi:hypothetical protein